MLKKIDYYILKRFYTSFIFIILLFSAISCVIDYSQKIEDFVKNKMPMTQVFLYYLTFIPFIISLLLPLFIFISTIFFTSKLAYKSEIIAMLATGTSFNRFLRPFIIGGISIAILAYFANNWWVPLANKNKNALENKYYHETVFSSDKNIHLQLSKNLYIYLQEYSYVNNNGTRLTAEKIDGIHLKEKLWAERFSFDSIKKSWHLYNVAIRTNDSLKESLTFKAEMEQNYPFLPQDLREDNDRLQAFTTPQLSQFIAKQKLHGNDNLNNYYVEKYKRTSQAFAVIILVLIGVLISCTKVRGGSGFHLALGIILCAIYIMILQFSSTLSMKTSLSPLMGVWIPNIIFSFLALYLYKKQVR